MDKCFFTKLVTWRDPNLSAAFLTVGNVVVALLLASGDALSWLLFALVFGVLPLGLAARLTGYDQNLRRMPATPLGETVAHSHLCNQMSPAGLIRAGVLLVVAANLVSVLGVPLAIGVAGNGVMLLPLAWRMYSPLVINKVKQLPVDQVVGLVKATVQQGTDFVGSFGPMAPAVAGGLAATIAVLIWSYLATSRLMLVANMKLIGYAIILLVALLPVSVTERAAKALIPSEATMARINETVRFKTIVGRATDLVLWDNYKQSITAFAILYGFYFVSSYIGVVFPLALTAGSFVAFTLTPTTLKEKAFAEVDKAFQQVRQSVAVPLQAVTASLSRTVSKEDLSPKAAEAADVSPKLATAGGSESPKKKNKNRRGSQTLTAEQVAPAPAKPVESEAASITEAVEKSISEPQPVEASNVDDSRGYE